MKNIISQISATRQLHVSDPEDMKIIRRLIEKALEMSIKKVTEKRKCMEYFYLKNLFHFTDVRERELYIGFSTRIVGTWK